MCSKHKESDKVLSLLNRSLSVSYTHLVARSKSTHGINVGVCIVRGLTVTATKPFKLLDLINIIAQ